ncbi:MAG TPA: hypothetical protein VMT38_12785 [Terracidiphilus sp.]|nr:hypothetical protein [Terracidiphilus sp.]
MAACDDCFQKFVHPLVHESMEKNERFEDKYGKCERWDWNSDLSVLTFSEAGKRKVQIHCSVVGTTQGDRWQWSWANRNIPDFAKSGMARVRDFGSANGYDKLTTPFIDADEYTGWEMTAVAVHVLESPGSYRFPTEHGYCYLVYREIKEILNQLPSENRSEKH